MTAVLVSVADAIVSELLLITGLVREIEPERSYADWDEKLEQLNELHVDVVPVPSTTETDLDGRGATRYQCDVDIGVRYRFDAEERNADGRISVEEIDELIELLQQFHDHFTNNGEGRRLTGFAGAVWQETKVRTWYVREHLRELAQYTGIIRVTYEALVQHA